MIKFFRKIRKKLIAENKIRKYLLYTIGGIILVGIGIFIALQPDNKISKYLLYAIGEIIIIGIGIFIALQLNNLNEKSGIHKKQKKHLRLVKGEMINNLESLRIENEKSLSIIEAERKIIALIELDVVNEKELSNHMRTITFNELLIPVEDGALNELIASGGLKDIENDSIRSMLASWEGKTTALRSQEIQLEDTRNAITKIVNADGSLRTIIHDIDYTDNLKIDAPANFLSNKSLLKSTAFENAILHHLLLAVYLGNNIYPKFESDMLLLVKLIDEELGLNRKK